MRVAQVIPASPPPEEGVGGFALALGAALAGRGLVSSCVAVADLPSRSPEALAAQLSGESTVLLHYSNYGYHRRGCPAWLIDGLERWRRGARGRRLVTVFHEVYASGPPWRSSFWLHLQQRRLAERLLRALRRRRDEPRATRRRASQMAPRPSTRCLPSLLDDRRAGRSAAARGAAASPPPLRRRWRARGAPGRNGSASCSQPAAASAIQQVWDLGAPACAPARLDGIPVRAFGELPAAEVGARLLDSYAGFLAYPEDFLGKSTIFAAYCAHGVLPVCAGRDGKTSGAPPHWRPSQAPPKDPGALAAAAHAWYDGHSLMRQAATFQELLAA